MAYKKLSEATLVESVAEETNVLVEENDEIKRVPVSKMGMSAGGGGGNKIGLIGVMDSEITKNNLSYDELKNNVNELDNTLNMDIIILHGTNGNYKTYFPDAVYIDDETNAVMVYFWDRSELVRFAPTGEVEYSSIG